MRKPDTLRVRAVHAFRGPSAKGFRVIEVGEVLDLPYDVAVTILSTNRAEKVTDETPISAGKKAA